MGASLAQRREGSTDAEKPLRASGRRVVGAGIRVCTARVADTGMVRAALAQTGVSVLPGGDLRVW